MKAPNHHGSVELIDSKAKKHKRSNPFRIRIVTGWKFDYETLSAKPIRKTIGYARTRAEGDRKLEDYHNNLYNLDMNRVTLNYLFGVWYEYKKKKVKEHKRYLSMFKHYNEIENKPFNTITANDLQRIVDEKLYDTTGGYQSRVINIYHQLYNYAKANNIKVGADVSFLVIKKEKELTSELHKPFTDEEIELLWNNRNKVVDLILICIYTGIRPVEMLVISEVHDDYFITGSKTAAGKNRVIPLHNKIKEMFHAAYDNGYFDSYSSEDSWYQMFKRKINPLYSKHTPYDTRHTFATLARRFKMDDHARKLIMGHHIDDLTNRVYTHVQIAELIEEINKIDI